MLMLVKLWPF